MKRIVSLTGIILLLLSMVIPTAVLGAENDDGKLKEPPKPPYEQMIYNSGQFITAREQDRMHISYVGSYGMADDLDLEPMQLMFGEELHSKFKVGSHMYLREVKMAHTFDYSVEAPEMISCIIEDGDGNLIGPLMMVPEEGYRIREVGSTLPTETCYSYYGEQEILLKPGDYKLYSSHTMNHVRNRQTGIYGGVAIKGVRQSTWDKYEKKWLEWAFDRQGIEASEAEELITEGSEDLFDYLHNDQEYLAMLESIGSESVMPIFTLDEPMSLEEVVFNTFNGGLGAAPGIIYIIDKNEVVIASMQASGESLNDVPNALWIARPGINLEAGTYRVEVSDSTPLVLGEDGIPEYTAAFGPPIEPDYNFSGHYKLDVTGIKTSNRLGAVSDTEPSFKLKGHALDLIDHGDNVEIISEYEGMMFSQICQVTERETDGAIAFLTFDLNLSNTPVGASIGADVLMTLSKPAYNAAKVVVEGEATYFRATAADGSGDFLSGGDNNTYRIQGVAYQTSKYFSGMVTKALAAAGITGLGNIPGPDLPIQGAVGVALPPLTGILGQAISQILERRRNKDKTFDVSNLEEGEHLSAGEKAMAEANQRLGKGLYDEKEAEGFAIMADALANSDEPDDDPFSIGDNEANGSDQSHLYDNDEGTFEPEAPDSGTFETERPLDDYMNDPYAGLSDEVIADLKAENGGELPDPDEYLPWEDPYDDFPSPDNWARKQIIDNSTGQPMDIVKDPYTGEWINPESGNSINLEIYRKDVLPNLERDARTIAKHRIDNMKSDPELVKAMSKIKSDENREKHMIKLRRKYGYGLSDDEIVGKIRGNQAWDMNIAKKQIFIGDINNVALIGAEVTSTAADFGVDVLAEVTGPAGKAIKTGYIGLKGFAGAAAKDMVESKDGEKSLLKSGMVGVFKAAGDLYKAKLGDMAGNAKGPLKYVIAGVGNFSGNLLADLGDIVMNGKSPSSLYDTARNSAVETGMGALFDPLGGNGRSYIRHRGGSTTAQKFVTAAWKNGRKATIGQAKGFTTNYVNSTLANGSDSTKKISTGVDYLDSLFLGKRI